MSRVIIAFESEANRLKLKHMLESGGRPVNAMCRSGADALRAARRLGGCVVICGCRLSDMTCDQLAQDLDGIAPCVALARPGELPLVSGAGLRVLPPPFPKEALFNLLDELDATSVTAPPKRSQADSDLIRQAKAKLMAQHNLTEPEAHRYLQRKSMLNGQKITETAKEILTNSPPLSGNS